MLRWNLWGFRRKLDFSASRTETSVRELEEILGLYCFYSCLFIQFLCYEFYPRMEMQIHYIQKMDQLVPFHKYSHAKAFSSQNHRMVAVGRDLCGSSSPTLLPKQGHLQQAAHSRLQFYVESKTSMIKLNHPIMIFFFMSFSYASRYYCLKPFHDL